MGKLKLSSLLEDDTTKIKNAEKKSVDVKIKEYEEKIKALTDRISKYKDSIKELKSKKSKI